MRVTANHTRATQTRRITRPASGFTLLELMITVTIVGILAAVANASYQDSVVKSRRKAAAACLTEASLFMERFYTTNMRYNTTNPGDVAVALPNAQCNQDLADHYTFALVAATLTASAFQITATPKGQQAANDKKCGTLSLDNTGLKGETGTGTVADCW